VDADPDTVGWHLAHHHDLAVLVEDFSAGLDYLSNHPLVGPDRIGLLGICGGGGYAVSVAQIDHRTTAVAIVSMYDLGRERRQGLDDDVPYEFRMKTLDAVAQERNKEFLGEPARFYNIETDLFGGTDQLGEKAATMASDLLDCYTTPRGAHPNGTGCLHLLEHRADDELLPVRPDRDDLAATAAHDRR